MKKYSKYLLLILLVAVLATCLIGCDTTVEPTVAKPYFDQVSDTLSPNFVYKDIVNKTLTGIVCVKSTSSGSSSNGSGCIISSDGYVVTNQHVTNGGTKFAVTVIDDNKQEFTYSATLQPRVNWDTETDISVLKITDPHAKGVVFEPLKFAKSSNVEFGDPCVMIGNPKGIGFMASRAMVANPSIKVSDQPNSLIAIDAPVNPGNSGGPLINANGEVIGVITFRFKSSGNDISDVVICIGFAQKSNDVVAYLKKLSYLQNALAYFA